MGKHAGPRRHGKRLIEMKIKQFKHVSKPCAVQPRAMGPRTKGTLSPHWGLMGKREGEECSQLEKRERESE